MSHLQKILIVEDETAIAHFMSAILVSNDYGVLHAKTGEEALTLFSSHRPDLVLLDLGLPDIDGIEVLRTIRLISSVPILIVSARGREIEKVEALDAGADDYVTKPFGSAELLARIRTAMRRVAQGMSNEQGHRRIIRVGELSIDQDKRIIALNEQTIHLTPIEYKILMLLVRHAGKVLTHDFIIRDVWGNHESDPQILRANMANIRRKLEKNPAEPKYIMTEVGVGYRFAEIE